MLRLIDRRCLSPDPQPPAPPVDDSELRSKVGSLEKRIDELTTRLVAAERTARACVLAFKQLEKTKKFEVMPEGNFYGTQF